MLMLPIRFVGAFLSRVPVDAEIAYGVPCAQELFELGGITIDSLFLTRAPKVILSPTQATFIVSGTAGGTGAAYSLA
jgi:hypothetical protein